MKRIAIVAAIVMLLGGGANIPVVAEEAPLLTNVSGRTCISLDGTWRYIVDPFESGYYDYRREPSATGFFDDEEPHNPALIEYDFDASPTIVVPRDWNTQAPELYYYEGSVWYRTRFAVEPQEESRYFLYFGAVNYEAIVYLNGERLGRHIGGFTPFNYEVTGLLRPGENSLVVKVSNQRLKEAVPTNNFDWWNYGGITRSVALVETPKTFVREYSLQFEEGKKIVGWVKLDGSSYDVDLTLEIPELKKRIALTPDEQGYCSFEISASPRLWEPENPKLYRVNWITPYECLSDEVGFRTITTSGNQILLNGRPIFCRGVSIHEEAPFRNGGRAYGVDDARTLLGWAKEMGCNFARLAHYPHNEFMVKEAERMGIMLWCEVPVYWTIDWDNPEVLENARAQMSAMITRDRNRCNVIIWSVANETPLSDARLDFLKEMVSLVREQDPTRLVSAAMEKVEVKPGVMTVSDPLGEYLDVFSFNQYIGWYDGLPEKCDRVEWALPSDKPVLISEFGGGALYGKHGDKSERWTEEFQADLYEANIRMLKKIKGLSGTTPWILMDFRSPKRNLPGIQDGYNRKGLISNEGKKKMSFYIMQKWYQEMAEGK